MKTLRQLLRRWFAKPAPEPLSARVGKVVKLSTTLDFKLGGNP